MPNEQLKQTIAEVMHTAKTYLDEAKNNRDLVKTAFQEHYTKKSVSKLSKKEFKELENTLRDEMHEIDFLGGDILWEFPALIGQLEKLKKAIEASEPDPIIRSEALNYIHEQREALINLRGEANDCIKQSRRILLKQDKILYEDYAEDRDKKFWNRKDISQGVIRHRFRAWIELQQQRAPNETDVEYKNRIKYLDNLKKHLNAGYCKGFSWVHRLLAKGCGDAPFLNDLQQIANWDGKIPMDKALNDKIEYYLQAIVLAHQKMPKAPSKNTENLTEGLDYQYQQSSRAVDIPQLLLPQNLEDTKIFHVHEEVDAEHVFKNAKRFADFLNKNANPQSMIYLSGHDEVTGGKHAIDLVINQSEKGEISYTIYDPNFKDGMKSFDNIEDCYEQITDSVGDKLKFNIYQVEPFQKTSNIVNFKSLNSFVTYLNTANLNNDDSIGFELNDSNILLTKKADGYEIKQFNNNTGEQSTKFLTSINKVNISNTIPDLSFPLKCNEVTRKVTDEVVKQHLVDQILSRNVLPEEKAKLIRYFAKDASNNTYFNQMRSDADVKSIVDAYLSQPAQKPQVQNQEERKFKPMVLLKPQKQKSRPPPATSPQVEKRSQPPQQPSKQNEKNDSRNNGNLFENVSEQVKERRAANSKSKGFEVAEKEWEFAKKYFEKYNNPKLDKKHLKRQNGKNRMLYEAICKEINIPNDEIQSFLNNFDHSFYVNREDNDIIAIKGKHHYAAEAKAIKEGKDRNHAELIPHGTFGKFRTGVSYKSGEFTGVKVESLSDLDELESKQHEIEILRKGMGKGAYTHRKKSQRKKNESFLGNENYTHKFISFQKCIEGTEIEDWLKASHTPEQKLLVAMNCCKALAEFQAKHLVHNDIKPANLMVDKYFNVHIIDYGMCEELTKSQTRKKLSTHRGSPIFMAPEMVRKRECGFHTDNWSMMVAIADITGISDKNKQYYLDNGPIKDLFPEDTDEELKEDLSSSETEDINAVYTEYFSQTDSRMRFNIESAHDKLTDVMINRIKNGDYLNQVRETINDLVNANDDADKIKSLEELSQYIDALKKSIPANKVDLALKSAFDQLDTVKLEIDHKISQILSSDEPSPEQFNNPEFEAYQSLANQMMQSPDLFGLSNYHIDAITISMDDNNQPQIQISEADTNLLTNIDLSEHILNEIQGTATISELKSCIDKYQHVMLGSNGKPVDIESIKTLMHLANQDVMPNAVLEKENVRLLTSNYQLRNHFIDLASTQLLNQKTKEYSNMVSQHISSAHNIDELINNLNNLRSSNPNIDQYDLGIINSFEAVKATNPEFSELIVLTNLLQQAKIDIAKDPLAAQASDYALNFGENTEISSNLNKILEQHIRECRQAASGIRKVRDLDTIKYLLESFNTTLLDKQGNSIERQKVIDFIDACKTGEINLQDALDYLKSGNNDLFEQEYPIPVNLNIQTTLIRLVGREIDLKHSQVDKNQRRMERLRNLNIPSQTPAAAPEQSNVVLPNIPQPEASKENNPDQNATPTQAPTAAPEQSNFVLPNIPQPEASKENNPDQNATPTKPKEHQNKVIKQAKKVADQLRAVSPPKAITHFFNRNKNSKVIPKQHDKSNRSRGIFKHK